jgi:hypothetical protein
MKTIKPFLLVLLLALSAGCKKAQTVNPYYVSLVMNGVSKYTTNATAYMTAPGGVLYTLYTTATFGAETLTLDFQPQLGVSYFQLDQAFADYNYGGSQFTAIHYVAYTGSVNVTSLTSTTVKGTFSFQATSTLDTPGQAVNGAFTIKMQ